LEQVGIFKGLVLLSPLKGKSLSVGVKIEFLELTLQLLPIWRKTRNEKGRGPLIFAASRDTRN